MQNIFAKDFSVHSTKFSLFIFFGLILFSVAFFVSAQSNEGGKNIFQDSDQDGLSNDEEKLYGTDPQNKDSDGDSYSDGVEIESGYNPLKKAPGDKNVIGGEDPAVSEDSAPVTDDQNLTNEVSQQILSVLQDPGSGDGSVSLDQVNEAVQNVLGGNTSEVVLPEIDIKEIKIKEAPSKSLSEKKRTEEEKQDVVEYLTVMSYLLANNSPKSFQTEDELGSMLSTITDQSIISLTSGNTQYIDQLGDQGEKILEDTKDIEVPEKMLDVHVKALKMAKYAKQLKEELKPNQNDPIGQIAVLSKVQGFLGVASSFSDEVHQKLVEYNIEEIPLDI